MQVRLAAALVLAAALALSACGAGAPVGGGSLSGQTVEMAGVWADKEEASFRKVLDAFERKTGVKVIYTSAGDELPTVLSTRLAGGSPPDVAAVPQPALMKSFAAAGSIQPLSKATQDIVEHQYSPVWKQLGSVDGKLYGFVFKAANKSTVWYDTRTVGPDFRPPATWSAFIDVLRSLSDTGTAPLSIGGADGWTLTDWFENVYLQSAGGTLYDQLAEHKIPWTDPSVRRAFDILRQAFQPQFIAGGTAGALQTEFNSSVVNVFGDNPKAAIVYEGDFVTGVIKQSTQATVGTTAKFFPFPALSPAPSVVSGGDTIVQMTSKPAAAALVEYLASSEAASIWAGDGGFISPNHDVAFGTYPDDTSRAIAQGLVSAANVRFDMSDLMPTALGGTKGDGFWKAMQDYLADPTKVDTILTDLEAKATIAYQGH